MLETSARLLRLLSLLQMHREWPGTELAERLGVTTRTVRRDVEKLRSLGYPVHAAPGAAGGYRLGAGASLPPLLLEDDEAVAVAVGLRRAAGGGVAGIGEASVRALAKLEQVLPARLRRRVGTLQSYTLGLPFSGPEVEPEVLTEIAGACRDHELLRFRYRSRGGAETRRVVEPYRLVSSGPRWYLVAWDPDRGDWRHFRVDRMELAPPFGPRFAPREHPGAEQLAEQLSWGVRPEAGRHRARLLLHASPAAMRERIPPESGTVEEVPGEPERALLTTGANALDALAVYVSLLEVEFEVVEPAELRERLAGLAARMGRAAGGVTPPGSP